jgi:hypothetical protein
MAVNESLSKALIARQVLSELPQQKIEALKPHIGLIKKVQESISADIGKCGIEDVCRQCSGVCCYSYIEEGIDLTTYFYILSVISEEERKRIFCVLNASSPAGYCRLLTKNGCILPDYARPIICKSFFCGKIPNGFKLMKKYNKYLDKAFGRLDKKLTSILAQI